jgi:hypothetical protein
LKERIGGRMFFKSLEKIITFADTLVSGLEGFGAGGRDGIEISIFLIKVSLFGLSLFAKRAFIGRIRDL